MCARTPSATTIGTRRRARRRSSKSFPGIYCEISPASKIVSRRRLPAEGPARLRSDSPRCRAILATLRLAGGELQAFARDTGRDTDWVAVASDGVEEFRVPRMINFVRRIRYFRGLSLVILLRQLLRRG